MVDEKRPRGRPPLPERRIHLTIRLKPLTLAQLRALRAYTGRPITEIIETLILERLKEQAKSHGI